MNSDFDVTPVLEDLWRCGRVLTHNDDADDLAQEALSCAAIHKPAGAGPMIGPRACTKPGFMPRLRPAAWSGLVLEWMQANPVLPRLYGLRTPAHYAPLGRAPVRQVRADPDRAARSPPSTSPCSAEGFQFSGSQAAVLPGTPEQWFLAKREDDQLFSPRRRP